jgi:Cys-rich protein (TIGR01571 family)
MAFTTGLCDCMKDVSSCVDIYCCWPCQMGRQCAAADTADPKADTCNCCGCLCGLCFPICVTCQIRRNVAARFAIDEGCCCALCVSAFCLQCSLCQTHRELTVRGTWPGGVCCHKQPGDFSNAPVQ